MDREKRNPEIDFFAEGGIEGRGTSLNSGSLSHWQAACMNQKKAYHSPTTAGKRLWTLLVACCR